MGGGRNFNWTKNISPAKGGRKASPVHRGNVKKGSRMTRVLLLRHGHVEGISPLRFRGRAALPLSDLGRRQAAALGRHIARLLHPDAVYTSPLERCRDTAGMSALPFGLEPRIVEALADIDYGAWQGLTPEEARARWPEEVETWFARPHQAAIPDGETLPALFARTTAALNEILRRHREGTLLVVAHESVNRALLLYAMELPLSRYWQLGQEPAALNDLEWEGGSFFIRSLNETQHLAGLS
jgi:broad specificity phosphatase PhoE